MEHGKRRRLLADSEPYEPVFRATQARNGADHGMPGVVTGVNENSQTPLEQHDETAPMFQARRPAPGGTGHVMTPVWHLEDSQSCLQRQGAVPNLEASVDTDETFSATVKVGEWLERAGFCNVPASDTAGNRSLAIAEVGTNVGHVPTWSADPRLVDGFRALVRQEVSILEDRLDKLFGELEKRSAERNEKIARMLDGIKCVLAEGDAEIRKVRIAIGLPSAEDVSDPAGP
ncbi:uncharacterized protein LOC144143022 [Haemaphysalis longicornis]